MYTITPIKYMYSMLTMYKKKEIMYPYSVLGTQLFYSVYMKN